MSYREWIFAQKDRRFFRLAERIVTKFDGPRRWVTLWLTLTIEDPLVCEDPSK